ncbi:formiminoglutamase [Microvirga tunisiensis]|uniref:Formiminoglutamase n=2 Tax=Pannonibacter tanglangensis TaxID=2750084 RepID=A0A7X5F4D3_9HYPH|nr:MULTISPECIES: N-formylglutamate amidohydrolase [unclassified Pannonibacter]NBN65019.1 formiminoglutamase [Pannonibacter sp. XCT-34]NBN79528.1 formiminoglutamase [Pannonibacter sp. XCT-53]
MIVVEERTAPLLVMLPHSGQRIPRELERRMTATGRLQTDISWHLEQVIDFAGDLGLSIVRTPFSRLVIDVDRDPVREADGQPGDPAVALCPLTTMDGKRLYQAEEDPGPVEIDERRRLFHEPFHVALAAQVERLKAANRRVVILNIQSLRSRIKGRYPGELPLVNIGTCHGRSCHEDVTAILASLEKDFPGGGFSENDITTGGFVAQMLGQPRDGIHVITLVLAQRAYIRHETPPFEMDKERLKQTRAALRRVAVALIDWANGTQKAPPRTLLDPLPDFLSA